MIVVPLLKIGVDIVTQFGVGTVVGNLIKATTPVATKGLSKLAVTTGKWVLVGIASTAAAEYTDKQIDKIVERTKAMFEEKKPEVEVVVVTEKEEA